MVKRLLFYLIILLLSSLTSHCSRGREDEYCKISLSNIENDELEFSPIQCNHLASPSRIKFYNEKSVMIGEKRSRVILRLFDIETGICKDSITRGRGPGECLSAWDISVDDDGKIIIFDNLASKLLVFKPENDKFFSLVDEIALIGYYTHIIPFKESGYLALPYQGGRFVKLSSQGIAEDTLGSFPPIKGANNAINNISAQSLSSFSPEGDYLCSTFLSMNYIDIYSGGADSLIKRIWGPERIIPSAKIVNVAGGYMYSIKPNKRVFSGLCTYDIGFIVGYERPSMKQQKKVGFNELLFFDWNGNCYKMIHLPIDIKLFDIDWNHRRLLAITSEEDPRLVSSVFN